MTATPLARRRPPSRKVGALHLSLPSRKTLLGLVSQANTAYSVRPHVLTELDLVCLVVQITPLMLLCSPPQTRRSGIHGTATTTHPRLPSADLAPRACLSDLARNPRSVSALSSSTSFLAQCSYRLDGTLTRHQRVLRRQNQMGRSCPTLAQRNLAAWPRKASRAQAPHNRALPHPSRNHARLLPCRRLTSLRHRRIPALLVS